MRTARIVNAALYGETRRTDFSWIEVLCGTSYAWMPEWNSQDMTHAGYGSVEFQKNKSPVACVGFIIHAPHNQLAGKVLVVVEHMRG